jgi:soluble lytic murein transglycosylase-like protein
MINQAFGPYGPEAVTVASCESSLNPDAFNPSGAAGLFQIMSSTWAGTAEAGQSPYNPAANIAAAYQIFARDGYSWREWTCQP